MKDRNKNFGFTPLEILKAKVRFCLGYIRGNRKFLTGFTLIEAIVATAVFAVAMVSMVGVYLSVQRLNQQSASLQVLQQNNRFIIESITKAVRNGAIDYAAYGSPIPVTGLSRVYLRDQNGAQFRVSLVGTNLQLDRGALGVSNLNGQEVKVNRFWAYVFPSTDPYAGGATKEQPMVTILMELQSNINSKVVIRMPIQTSIAVRRYD